MNYSSRNLVSASSVTPSKYFSFKFVLRQFSWCALCVFCISILAGCAVSLETSNKIQSKAPLQVPGSIAGGSSDVGENKTESSKPSETERELGALNDEVEKASPEPKCTTEIDASKSVRSLRNLIERASLLQSEIATAETNPARMSASRKKVLQSSAERFKGDAEKWQEQNTQLIEGCALLLNAHGDSSAPGVPASLHMLELSAIDLNSSMEAAAFDNAQYAKLFLQAAQARVKFAGKLLTCKKCALVHNAQPFSKKQKMAVADAQQWLNSKSR